MGQSTLVYWLPYPSHTSYHSSQISCHPLISYVTKKNDARFLKDGSNAVWSIPYVSVTFFPSFKQGLIAYRSSKVSSRPDCIFEIHQLWQSGFSRVYFNSCSNCSFEYEIIKIGQSLVLYADIFFWLSTKLSYVHFLMGVQFCSKEWSLENRTRVIQQIREKWQN